MDRSHGKKKSKLWIYSIIKLNVIEYQHMAKNLEPSLAKLRMTVPVDDTITNTIMVKIYFLYLSLVFNLPIQVCPTIFIMCHLGPQLGFID